MFVARTVDKRDRKLGRFLLGLAAECRGEARIRTSDSVHMTVLDNDGLARTFHSRGYTAQGVLEFYNRLEAVIRGRCPHREMTVSPDTDQPFGIFGRAQNILGIRIVQSPQILEQREMIEDFIVDELGGLPKTRAFDPHIALGACGMRLLERVGHDPQHLLRRGLEVPKNIALNGLEVYVGAIHPVDRYVPAVAA